MHVFVRRPFRAITLTTVAILVLGSLAVAQDDQTTVLEEVAAPVEASIVDFSFQPATVEVAAGTAVTWTNDDGVPHTVTAPTGDFDSGVLEPGASFSQMFDEPGTFDYVCAIHPSMSATVQVAEAAAEGDDEPTDDEGSVATVEIVDLAFVSADIDVAMGGTVEWTNADPFAHTVTASDGGFDSGSLDPGQSFSQTFDEPGTFDYFCAIHPAMTGTVTVSEPAP